MEENDEAELMRLRNEVKALREMFRQLTEEEKSESYDLRRSKMLKAQVMQLERQCMLLSDALSSRASVMIETENELISVIELLQGTLTLDTPGPTVTISRKQLISHIHAFQKLKGSMQKQSILSGAENLRIPQLSGSSLCKTKNVSCLDVCSGKRDHLNLQHVAYLENKLVELSQRLTCYQTLLQSFFVKDRRLEGEKTSPQNSSERDFPEKYLFSAGFKRVLLENESCIREIEDCSQNLLAFSLLHPSAPWSVTKTPNKFGLFEASTILSRFPANLQRHKDVKSIIDALCKAHSYLTHVNEMRLNAVQKEVDFCGQINATYAHYMNCLLDGVKEAYNACETNLSKLISEPLNEILDTWNVLKAEQSDTTLRELMSCLKRNETTLSRLVERMSPTPRHGDVKVLISGAENAESGLKVLESFGAELTERIELLKRQCAKNSSCQQIKLKDYMYRNETDVIERLRNMLQNSINCS